MAGVAGAASGLLAVEVCVPLLMLCWFCCWPDDRSETSSNGKVPRKPVIAHDSPRRRSLGLFSRRAASSAASLHLPVPSTSGVDSPLQFRSHEELRRGASTKAGDNTEGRYHSAPSVIDQVLHRRDWERSNADLRRGSVERNGGDIMMIPLRDPSAPTSPPPTPQCKKHHTNIKKSKHKEQSRNQEYKDIDQSVFRSLTNSPIDGAECSRDLSYTVTPIDGAECSQDLSSCEVVPIDGGKVCRKSMYRAKEAKQCLNESIKCKKQLVRVCEGVVQTEGVDIGGREGAVHGEGRDLNEQFSPLSVEAAGYELSECYLSEPPSTATPVPLSGRGRHASDGDILAPAGRPESGAFSENDLELSAEITKALEEGSKKFTTKAPRTPSATKIPRVPKTSRTPRETAI